jgi:hypothetical protein
MSGADWAALCCDGEWKRITAPADGGTPSCPEPVKPGDEFTCVGAEQSCVAAESACLEHTQAPAFASIWSCEPLCDAGDCSCFCDPDDSGACGFDPPDKVCPADFCYCDMAYDELGLPAAGTVAVRCAYDDPTAPECSPVLP